MPSQRRLPLSHIRRTDLDARHVDGGQDQGSLCVESARLAECPNPGRNEGKRGETSEARTRVVDVGQALQNLSE